MSEPSDLAGFAGRLAEFQKTARMPDEIEFPIQVSAVEITQPRSRADRIGKWCSIRPIHDQKTYLGIYLGDLTFSIDYHYRIDSQAMVISPHSNPAIFVPDLKRVVWGVESWWGFIETPEQLHQISDTDIQNVWYVKALKELTVESAP